MVVLLVEVVAGGVEIIARLVRVFNCEMKRKWSGQRREDGEESSAREQQEQ
ncbi:hypothetical protein SOVF_195440, partial [Spinacia oleracea]